MAGAHGISGKNAGESLEGEGGRCFWGGGERRPTRRRFGPTQDPARQVEDAPWRGRGPEWRQRHRGRMMARVALVIGDDLLKRYAERPMPGTGIDWYEVQAMARELLERRK